MILTFKNKFFSWGGSSQVFNQNGEVCFDVKGKIFSLRRQKSIYDKEGNLLYIVRNKFFNFLHHTTFIYDSKMQVVGKISKHALSLTNSFNAQNFEHNIQLVGKIFRRNLQVIKDDKEVAILRREFNMFVDTYTISTNEPDIEFYVALTVAMDNLRDNREDG